RGDDVLDLAHAAERVGADDRITHVVGHEVVEVGADDRWRDAIHVDAAVADLTRERTREANHPGLGRGYVGKFSPAAHPAGAASIDDLSALLFEHVRDHEARAEEHATQMHLDHIVPCLHGHVGELERIEHSGVIDEDVDGPKSLSCGVHHAFDVFDLADVCAHGNRFAAISLDSVNNRVCLLL